MDIRGASALVTGGASGLGFATARRLASAGAHVTLIDREGSGGPHRAAEIGGSFIAADVTREDEVRAAVDRVSEAGTLRCAVNCAGVAPPAKVIDRAGRAGDLASFAKLIEVNLIGTYNVTAQAAAAMSRTEPLEDGHRGVIVNTSSVAAFEGQVGQAAYAASKGGVHAMTLPIARELARHGIRVCAIAPGVMDTPMLRGLPPNARDSLGTQVPFPARLGFPEEFATLVLSIIGNDYLNGETIRLDGGLRMSAH